MSTSGAEIDFESVYRDHVAFVWQVLHRLGVRSADIEDVAQEVFVTVHRKLASFERRSSVKTWVYAIAFRAASEHRRRAHVRRERPTADVDAGAASSTPLEGMAQREARVVLQRILDSMSADKRVVFVLYELEQLTMPEVAEVVGCPLQTAYSRLHSAREVFQDAVRRYRAKESRR